MVALVGLDSGDDLRAATYGPDLGEVCAGAPNARATNSVGGLTWSNEALVTLNPSHTELVAKKELEAVESMRPRSQPAAGSRVFD